MTIEVLVEDDAPLLPRVFANRLRCCLQRPGSDEILKGLKTTFALKSTKNAHAVTIAIENRMIKLSHGVAKDSQIIIHMDFDNPTAGERVEGLWRHPLLAMKIGKLMSLPLPNWADSAKRYWKSVCNDPYVPESLRVTCTDEKRSLTLGGGEGTIEIHGTSAKLAEIFSGNTLLLQEVMAGHVRFRGHLKYLAGLSGSGQKIMMGEIEPGKEGDVHG